MSARNSIAAQMSVPGANIQVLDYRWQAGEKVSEVEHNHVIRYRSYPVEVSLAADIRKRSVNFGQLMFFPADIPVETSPANSQEVVRNVLCRFDPEWFARILNVSREAWDDDSIAKCFDVRNVRIEQAVQRLGAEVVNPSFASEIMVESLSNMIAVEIARHFEEPDRDLRVRTRDGRLSDGDLSRIYEFVNSMENKCPSIKEISDLCHISAAHLRRSFKSTTGQTVHSYVEDVRLKKAQRFLIDTDLPLKEISFRLGFANSSTFSSTFKRSAGEAPSLYRSRHR